MFQLSAGRGRIDDESATPRAVTPCCAARVLGKDVYLVLSGSRGDRARPPAWTVGLEKTVPGDEPEPLPPASRPLLTGEHEPRLRFFSPGVAGYAFTFG